MTDSTELEEESLVSLDTYLETNYSDVNLSNLTENGEAHFANPSLSNLNSAGQDRFVTKDTAQTVSGEKTFTTLPTFKNTDLPSNATVPSSDENSIWEYSVANDGSYIGGLGYSVTTDATKTLLFTQKNIDGVNVSSYSGNIIQNDGTCYFNVQTPPAGHNTTSAATTAWVTDATLSTNVVHRNSDETITGVKNFSTYNGLKTNTPLLTKQSTTTGNEGGQINFERAPSSTLETNPYIDLNTNAIRFVYQKNNGTAYFPLRVNMDSNTCEVRIGGADRALVSDGNGKIAVSNVTAEELGFISGVNYPIQAQLNNKQDILSSGVNIKTVNNTSLLGSGNLIVTAHVTGAASTIVADDLTASCALVSDSNGKVAASSITSTKLGYLTDVTSNIQNQINQKQASLVSGTNIKTINNTTVLGSGNIDVQPTLVSGTNIKTVGGESILGSGNIAIARYLMPNYSGKTSYTPNTSVSSNGFVIIAARDYDRFPSILVNDVAIIEIGAGNYNCTTSSVIPVCAGDRVTHTGTLVSAYFVPCIGG